MQLCFLTADSVAPDSQIKRSPPPRSPPTFDELATTIAGVAGIFTIAAVPPCSWTRRGTHGVCCDLQIRDIKTKSNIANTHNVRSTTPSGGEHRQRGSRYRSRWKRTAGQSTIFHVKMQGRDPKRHRSIAGSHDARCSFDGLSAQSLRYSGPNLPRCPLRSSSHPLTKA